MDVAWGLASRLRLKHTIGSYCLVDHQGRMGAGFSSEIETDSSAWQSWHWRRRMGAGFSSEIETLVAAREWQARLQSHGGWLLV